MATRVIVDASVARSASADPVSADAWVCTDALRAIAEKPEIRLVMSPQLLAEWDTVAQGTFASNWLATMYSTGRVDKRGDAANQALRGAIATTSQDERAAILHDIHLTECALATGAVVLSRDWRQRHSLQRLVTACNELGDLCWVVLQDRRHEIVPWIRADCPLPFRALSA